MVKNSNHIIGIPISDPPPFWHSSLEKPEKKLEGMIKWGSIEEDSYFCDYEKCDKLSNLINGKRVAIVGPSGHLSGKKNGELIDSYDIVVRVNHMPQETDEYRRDYGIKTDIIADGLNIHGWARFDDNIEYVKNLKYIIVPQAWDSPPAEVKNLQQRLDNYGVPNNRISTGHFYKVCKDIGTCMNTGFSAIVMLLNYQVKELYVTGFSFYDMLGVSQKSQTNDQFYFCKRKTKEWKFKHDLHQQLPQINYFHKIIVYHYGRKLNLDDYLLDNFSKSVNFVRNKLIKKNEEK